MTVPMIKSIGDVPYPIDTHSDTFSPLLTAGAALGITGDGTDSAEWLQRVSTSDGPTTIRGIHGNTIVQDGSLLPVRMEGVETVGFNQWDEVWEVGSYSTTTGAKVVDSGRFRCANYIFVFPSTAYYIGSLVNATWQVLFYDAGKSFISSNTLTNETFTTPVNCRYITFYSATGFYGTTYNHDICINISDATRNGEYEPHWSSQREIAAATYFPDGMRSAGSVRDELTSTEAITRVGSVDLGMLEWIYWEFPSNPNRTLFCAAAPNDIVPAISSARAENIKCANYETVVNAIAGTIDKTISYGAYWTQGKNIYVYDSAYGTNAAAFQAAMSGVILYYELATPTVTPIDPPLNMTYRTEQGGTERVIIPTGEQSAPPTIVTAQGYTAESLRDAALSAIAPVENGLASTNYAVGSYLVHGGQLCKVTTAIATGEAITIGTNVTATTVMAEVIALIAQ